MLFLTFVLCILCVLLVIAVRRLFRYRARLRRFLNEYRLLNAHLDLPLPVLPHHEFDPIFHQTEMGPGLQTETFHIGARIGDLASATNTESWVLSVLAKKAESIFEFGTTTGRTTYLLARNSPENARVLSLAADESRHSSDPATRTFAYSGSSVEGKIQQLAGDSMHFDESVHLQQFDLIFIDGSRASSSLKSDTEKALRMLKPNGVLLWRGCRGAAHPITGHVSRYLIELDKTHPISLLAGTSIAAYRHTEAAAL